MILAKKQKILLKFVIIVFVYVFWSHSIAAVSVAKEQAPYLKLLNQYRMLKMKHLRLEEKVAVVAARQKNSTRSLGLNTGLGYGSGSGFGLTDNAGEVDYSADLDQDASAITNDSGYGLVYAEKQNGQWNATINYNGKFHEIVVGSVLPDGSKVIDITKLQVILKKDAEFSRLTYSGMMSQGAGRSH